MRQPLLEWETFAGLGPESRKQSPSTGRLPLNTDYPCFCSLKPNTTETWTKRLPVAVLLHVRQCLFPLNSCCLKVVRAASFGTTAGTPAASMFPRTCLQEKSAGTYCSPLVGGSHQHCSSCTQRVRRMQSWQGRTRKPVKRGWEVNYWLKEWPSLFPHLLQMWYSKICSSAFWWQHRNKQWNTAAGVYPVSFPAEGSTTSKSPRSKLVSVHCCCFWNCLPYPPLLSVRQVTPPSIENSFSQGTPNSFLPKSFTNLLLWGFWVLCNTDWIAETENSPGWLKHVLLFSHFWQRSAWVPERRKSTKEPSISQVVICIIFTTCLLLYINTYEQLSPPACVVITLPVTGRALRLYLTG